MIEAAAQCYCKPVIAFQQITHHIEGKTVLEIIIPESSRKPIYAIDEEGKPKAYIRIADENILADIMQLEIWKQNDVKRRVVMTYSEREQKLLTLIGQQGKLTLSQCVKLSGLSRYLTVRLLADFIRFGLIVQKFEDHRFFFVAVDEISKELI